MRYGGVPIRRSGFQRSAEDDGGNHNAECTTNDEVSRSFCKKCDVEVLNGQLSIMCDMFSIWFHEECSALSKKQLNVIGEIDACKWFCGWCLDNVDDRVKCVSNNLEMKNIEDMKRLVTSFNTNKPSYASKYSEKPPTNVNETCTDNRKYPDEQTLYISGTIDGDILLLVHYKNRGCTLISPVSNWISLLPTSLGRLYYYLTTTTGALE